MKMKNVVVRRNSDMQVRFLHIFITLYFFRLLKDSNLVTIELKKSNPVTSFVKLIDFQKYIFLALFIQLYPFCVSFCWPGFSVLG